MNNVTWNFAAPRATAPDVIHYFLTPSRAKLGFNVLKFYLEKETIYSNLNKTADKFHFLRSVYIQTSSDHRDTTLVFFLFFLFSVCQEQKLPLHQELNVDSYNTPFPFPVQHSSPSFR